MNRIFMIIEEIAMEMRISESYAYKSVKRLNEELQKLGYYTVFDKMSTNCFGQKYGMKIINLDIVNVISVNFLCWWLDSEI